jgi:hypothetical protein
VTISLGGTVDNLGHGQYIEVRLTVPANPDSGRKPRVLASQTAYPDKDGRVALKADTQAPVGSSLVQATIKVLNDDDTEQHSFDLSAAYTEVPKPAVQR